MKKITSVLAALAIAGLLSLAAPASAERADNPPGACPSSEAVTQTEVDQLAIGMRKFQVLNIIGSTGHRDKDASAPDYLVRQWTYCLPDGSLQGRQGVMFERSAAGHWVVQEIG